MRVCPYCFALYGPDQITCSVDGEATKHYTEVLIGRTLGPYVVRSLVGEGGMGVVFVGEHPALGKRVALKVLRPELSLREDIVERFVQEARAVNTIGHSNIVNIYDFGRTPFGSFYIVMEYLDGKTLRDIMDETGPQPLERVRTVLTGVGAALASAHGKGFIHRDVKPENIMIINRQGQERVKLLDFGIVKLLTDDGQTKTQTGSGMGTPQYMSPEQLEEGRVDHRADIFALGAVAYEMLTGHVPYPGKTHAEVRQRQLTQAPAPPSTSRPDTYLARSVDSVILWSVALDPSERCGRMEDLVTAFMVGYERSLVDAAQGNRQQPKPNHTTKLIFGAGLVAFSAAVGAIVAIWLKGGFAPTPPAPHPAQDSRPPLVAAAPKKIPLPVARKQARSMLEAALKAKNPKTRANAVRFLGEMKRPALLPQLRQAIQDPDPKVSQEAALALAAMNDQEAIPALHRALKNSVDFKSLNIARALAQLGDKAGVARLEKEIKSPRTEIHEKHALHALGAIGHGAARRWKKILEGGRLVDTQLRIKALGYLAAQGDQSSLHALENLTKNGEWGQRIDAAKALGPIQPEAVKELLRTVIQKTEGVEKQEAALALAHLEDDGAAHYLLMAAKTGDATTRRACALALGRLKSPKGRQWLARALDDPDPEVALAAAAGLVGQ